MSRTRGTALFWLALAALAAGLAVFAPITQPVTYHDFADARTQLGVPNFWNVTSNVPFLMVGIMGLVRVTLTPALGAARTGWYLLFGGTAAVGFASGYYHLAPDDATLVWDRLPIGVAFAGLFSVLVSENVDERIGRRVLFPGVLFAIAAVYWWRATGDLSPWIFVQAAPMLGIALVLALFTARASHRRYFAYALAWYVAAKLFELWDRELHELSAGLVSGHPLKHLAAAAGVWCLYEMLRRRSLSAHAARKAV